jgi:hypothetical protein
MFVDPGLKLRPRLGEASIGCDVFRLLHGLSAPIRLSRILMRFWATVTKRVPSQIVVRWRFSPYTSSISGGRSATSAPITFHLLGIPTPETVSRSREPQAMSPVSIYCAAAGINVTTV